MIHLQVRLHLQVTILSHDRSNSIDGFIGSTPEKRGGIIDKKRETIKVGMPKPKHRNILTQLQHCTKNDRHTKVQETIKGKIHVRYTKQQTRI